MRIGVSVPLRELGRDIGAISAFVQSVDELGLTHLWVSEMVFRSLRREGPGIQEPMMLLGYIAAVTRRIELAPWAIILPARETILFAEQAAELDVLSGGRVRRGLSRA